MRHGSPVDVLRKEFPDIVLFDHVEHGWYLHEGEYAVDPKALNARAAKLRRFIRDRDEKEIVLVTHGFFAHYLTGDVNEKGEQTTGWWQETELRTFDFVDGGEKATIKETEESLLRNGVVGNDGQRLSTGRRSVVSRLDLCVSSCGDLSILVVVRACCVVWQILYRSSTAES